MSAIPVAASAQVGVGVSVGVGVDADSYDTTAPGDPVGSVDVFYDQLQPYGVWVDEPDIGRVYIPNTTDFVPYTVGHWQYTRLGFVWVSSEPFSWATSHYGRWAYSNAYGRWVWRPDTEWGPAWVEWRQTDNDFGWAPLAPAGYAYPPPATSWHYCGAAHVLDVNVNRYYEPRDRVVVIHREARPIEHYQTVSNVKVIVGPPPSVLRDHRVEVRPARVDARVVGRWTPGEARAQVTRAQEHQATFEVENQRRLEANTRIHTAQQRVIETHPQLKVKVDARVDATRNGRAELAPPPGRIEPNRGEPRGPAPGPSRVEPNRGESHGAPSAPGRPTPRAEPARPEPARERPAPPPIRAEPARPEPARERPAPPPIRAEPARPEPARERPAPPPIRAEPARPEPARERPAPPVRAEPPHPAPAQPSPRSEPPRAAPAPGAESGRERHEGKP